MSDQQQHTLSAIGRRGFVKQSIGLASALGMALTWPKAFADQRLRIIVGFPPGGGTDAVARLIGDRLRERLGYPVVVENKPGAGGQLAAQALKAAAPDGNTLFLSHDHSISILPMLVKNPGFDPFKDFVPVVGFASFVNAFGVSSAVPAKTFPEYLDWVKKVGGGKSTVGIPAPASTPEFLVKVLADRYKVDLQSAAYRGSAPMMADMVGNQIPAGVGSVQDLIEYHKAGKVRILAVLGKNRQVALPNVPTFAEYGLDGFEDMPYYGLFAPAGTPQAVIDQIGRAVQQAIAEPKLAAQMTDIGLLVQFMNQSQFASRVQSYTQAWAKIIAASGFKPQ